MIAPHSVARGWRALAVGTVAFLGIATARAAEPSASYDARFAVRADIPFVGRALVRPPLLAPARYRVVVVPGSGCVALDPSADRMFRGLLHAEVVLLQKPSLRSGDTDAVAECPPDFVREDRLSRWQSGVETLAGKVLENGPDDLPLVLAGLSEGAETLPGLASAWPGADLLVMVGHAGIDPGEAGALQARRLGAERAWGELRSLAQESDAGDDVVVHGRSLGYWRDLFAWRMQAPLLALPHPLLHAHGGLDALMPAQAYESFADRARLRPAGYCRLLFPDADHELRSPERDQLQSVWAWLERHARRDRRWPPECLAAPAAQP